MMERDGIGNIAGTAKHYAHEPSIGTLVRTPLSVGPTQDLVHHVISLLDAAMHQIYHNERTAQDTIFKAASLLRQQIDPPASQEAADGRGRLLAWQVRKVRDYIGSHITGPVLVADLGALVQLSEAHFSRCFRRSFGESPHAFVIQRRLELAAQYLETDMCLSDIALQCGFTDQAHLGKHFRGSTGETPAAWRRTRRTQDFGRRSPDI